MSKEYSQSYWLDVLYTSVRATPGGVVDAARFLAERRGKNIHPESLRSKLIGKEGESLSIEFAELLTEWMEEKANPTAKDWLYCFNAQYGFVTLKKEQSKNTASVVEVMMAFLDITSQKGHVSNTLTKIVEDGVITKAEAEEAKEVLAVLSEKIKQLGAQINGAVK